ncbi:MAG TPA: cytochrome c [Vicinamibacterales bacterium]|jgi:mono/diheme cytochrome c family protein|nr:cytochrome c [Vicinamibacterales bacterium]
MTSFRALALLVATAVGTTVFIGTTVVSKAQTPVTFSEHVAPIVFANCISCHRPGEAAPFSLLSYRDARPLAKAIASATASKVMPPWKAGPSDFAFENARRLTDEQIAIIQRWVADGAPEGDPAKTPALPRFTEGWQLGTPDLAVSMSEAFEVPAKGPDVYRNFVVPLNLDRDTWVRAIDFRPSARSVVHHSLFFLDASGGAREQDALDAVPGFPGGMGGGRVVGQGRGLAAILGNGDARAQADGVARAAGLGGWALGGRALELPSGLAFFVPKGSDLILSTHFHPSGKVEREKSSVGLYFASGPPTQAFTSIQLPPVFGVFEGVDIPAGQERYTISDSFVIPIDVRAFAVGAHAHYLAKEFTMKATLPDGAVKTLLSIGDWDFSWQERYRFKEFVALPKGTRLDVTVSYDNSAANKRNPSRPPVRVYWGEESTDEMGSIGLQVVAANRGELPQLQQAIAAHIRDRAFNGPGLRQLLQRRAGRGAGGGQ